MISQYKIALFFLFFFVLTSTTLLFPQKVYQQPYGCPGSQSDPYKSCLGSQCLSFPGCGDTVCNVSSDCPTSSDPTPTPNLSCPAGETDPHGVCSGNTCAFVPGCGLNLCTSNLQCVFPTSTPFPTPPGGNGTYSIRGSVFIDENKNGLKDLGPPAESNYSGSITIESSGGTVSYPVTGSFLISGLSSGEYTVSYTSLPSGYTMTFPKNGPPPQLVVNVGQFCDPIASRARCDVNGNIIRLNFGISNAQNWFQCIGASCRRDKWPNDPIPSTASAACGGAYASIPGPTSDTPGIIYTGDSSPSFGSGQASSTQWVVGGTTYSELFTPVTPTVIKTSYNTLLSAVRQSGITPSPLTSACVGGSLTPCTLLPGLANGIYQGNGPITLNGYQFPANRNYVFLINGDMTIRGNILVPNGSTATFSTSGGIYVNTAVGVATPDINCIPSNSVGGISTGCNLEGFYSTDTNFTIEGINYCSTGTDLRFNLAGSVVVNAALGGGSFINRRDICAGSAQCPTYTFTLRPDLILNSPRFIKTQNYLWQEVAP